MGVLRQGRGTVWQRQPCRQAIGAQGLGDSRDPEGSRAQRGARRPAAASE